jgi:hypothetical protein
MIDSNAGNGMLFATKIAQIVTAATDGRLATPERLRKASQSLHVLVSQTVGLGGLGPGAIAAALGQARNELSPSVPGDTKTPVGASPGKSRCPLCQPRPALLRILRRVASWAAASASWEEARP